MYFVEIDVIFFARLYCMISNVKRGQKKKEKKIKEVAKNVKKKKIRQCVSFHFSETNLCMPIRVEHFDIVLHAFKCSLFLFFSPKAAALSPGPPAEREQTV